MEAGFWGVPAQSFCCNMLADLTICHCIGQYAITLATHSGRCLTVDGTEVTIGAGKVEAEVDCDTD